MRQRHKQVLRGHKVEQLHEEGDITRQGDVRLSGTKWVDVSEFDVIPVNDEYQWPFLCFRSNEGNHRDKNFPVNREWADRAVASGRIFGYLVCYLYEPGVDGASVLQSMVISPNPRMAVMIDVESSLGKVSGDQSARINAEYRDLASWLGDRRRVVGYGTPSDLHYLWQTKPDGLRVVISAYGGENVDFPGKFGRVYSDQINVPPFYRCNAHIADGMAPVELEVMFGFTSSATDVRSGRSSAPSTPQG